MAESFDLSEYRNRHVRGGSGLAYFAWFMSGCLGSVAIAASGLFAGLPPDPGHHALAVAAGFAALTIVIGYAFFLYPRRRFRAVRVVVEKDGAKFTMKDGAIEELRWPAADTGSGSQGAPTIRLADWSAVPRIADEDRYVIWYQGPGSKLRFAPLTAEAFGAIRESWRASGCKIVEETRPPPGREGMIAFLLV